MPAIKPNTGTKTTLSIGSGGGSETFTVVAQIKTFSFAGQTWTFDETTALDSPAFGDGGVLKQYRGTEFDPGTMALGGVYAPSDAGQLALTAAFRTGLLTDFKLTLPLGPGQTVSGNVFAFSAYVQDNPLPDISSKVLTFKATLKLNTDIVITLGS